MERQNGGVLGADASHGCAGRAPGHSHWSSGYIGSFPTYTIGNLLSAQLYNRALEEHPSIPSEIEQGNMRTLLAWLRDRVHRHGSRYTFAELVKEITGGEVQVGPFMKYLSDKFREIYS